jgi:hypothetical protein
MESRSCRELSIAFPVCCIGLGLGHTEILFFHALRSPCLTEEGSLSCVTRGAILLRDVTVPLTRRPTRIRCRRRHALERNARF